MDSTERDICSRWRSNKDITVVLHGDERNLVSRIRVVLARGRIRLRKFLGMGCGLPRYLLYLTQSTRTKKSP